MPTLILKFKDKSIGDYQLQKGVSMTIGRSADNDVVIDNLAVSGHHAKIDSVGDGFVLIDLQSKNGSFVNEQIVNSHWLNNGDVINIGKHSLVFNYTEGEQRPNDDAAKIEKTMVMETSQYRSMMKKSKFEIPKPLGRKNNRASAAGLAFLAGGSGKIKLSGNITKIGKHPKSDIVIKGMWVGRTSFTIGKKTEGFCLSYVGGIAKPRVNDKTIKNSILLNDLDIIDIGATKLQFHELNSDKTKHLKNKK